MFKIQAVITKKTKIRDRHIWLSLLTEEYGKINGWFYKKECEGDIGSLCEIIIYRKNGVNIIENLRSIWSPLRLEWNYRELVTYLEIIKLLHIFSRENMAHIHIVKDYHIFIRSLDEINRETKFTLFVCRFMKQCGILSDESFTSSSELSRIYHHIDRTPIERIMSSQKVHMSIVTSLQSSIRYSLLSWNQTFNSSY